VKCTSFARPAWRILGSRHYHKQKRANDGKGSARNSASISSVAHPREISVRPTKGLTNQRDLALAISPGVAVSDDKLGQATTRLLEDA